MQSDMDQAALLPFGVLIDHNHKVLSLERMVTSKFSRHPYIYINTYMY
jgi:hypothetical protein